MENNIPALSIVMPLYNKEKEVGPAIQSIRGQTFSDFEVIVVNDGSTDEGPDVVRSFTDSRIRLTEQNNAGVSAARNRGIAEAKGNLIAFLDADDEWEPDFLETILRLRASYPQCEVFATRYFIRRRNGYQRPASFKGLPEHFDEGILTDYFGIAARSDPPLWTSAVAVSKDAINSVGRFPVGVTSGEDLLTWARLALKYKIAYSMKPKAHFWGPTELSDRPGRVPQTPDLVGEELRQLLETAPYSESDGLKEYVALWHRMRADIFIRLGERPEALREINKSVRYSRNRGKLFVLGAVAVMPKALSKTLYKCLKRAYSSGGRKKEFYGKSQSI